MTWFFTILMLALAGWAVWRGLEAYTFSKMIDGMTGELTQAKVRRFMERLSPRTVPNAPKLWSRLRELERRVMAAGAVSPEVKSEFKTLLDSKSVHF